MNVRVPCASRYEVCHGCKELPCDPELTIDQYVWSPELHLMIPVISKDLMANTARYYCVGTRDLPSDAAAASLTADDLPMMFKGSDLDIKMDDLFTRGTRGTPSTAELRS